MLQPGLCTFEVNVFEEKPFPDLAAYHTEQGGRHCSTMEHKMSDWCELVFMPLPLLRDHTTHTSIESRLLKCPEQDGLLYIVGGVAFITQG